MTIPYTDRTDPVEVNSASVDLGHGLSAGEEEFDRGSYFGYSLLSLKIVSNSSSLSDKDSSSNSILTRLPGRLISFFNTTRVCKERRPSEEKERWAAPVGDRGEGEGGDGRDGVGDRRRAGRAWRDRPAA